MIVAKPLLIQRGRRFPGYSSKAGSAIAFAGDDVEQSMATLRRKGVEFLHEEPALGPAGRYVAFTDPFGTVHELVETRVEKSGDSD